LLQDSISFARDRHGAWSRRSIEQKASVVLLLAAAAAAGVTQLNAFDA
jgi:hypothetical protein